MGFRFINQLPQFLDAAGQVLSGGQLAFYQSGTTTPQDTYTDDTLTKANPNPLELDSTGRPTADIWMNGTYRVVLLDATGATIWTRDDVEQPGGTTFSLPTLVAGQFLTNDGTNPLWAPVLQVPSVTGAGGKVLGTDGSTLFWQPPPGAGANGTNGTNAAVTVTSTSVSWSNGTGDRFFIQSGSGSAPASGGHGTSTDITFPTAFKAIAAVIATPTSNSFATSGYQATVSVLNKSTTGFTASFDTNSSDGSNGNIINALPFDWVAFGTVAGP